MNKCETLEKMIQLSGDDRERTGKVVARSFYRILKRNGFSHSDIMNFAGNLLDEVMADMRRGGVEKKRKEGPADHLNRGQREVA